MSAMSRSSSRSQRSSPGLALLGVLGGLVGGRLEVGVAEPAPAAARDLGLLAGLDEIGHELAGPVVVHGRARRNGQDHVLARPAVLARPEPATARRRP